MKQKLSLVLITLLLFNIFTPSVLAAEEENEISYEVTSPVLTISPSAITLTCFDEPERTDAVAFAVGTPKEDIDAWFAEVTVGFTCYDTENNLYDLITNVWSLDTLDTATPGLYYTFATPDLGTEYTLADGVLVPRQLCAVSIQTPGKPDINCCVSGRGFLRFPWVLSTEQLEQLDEFAVLLRQDNGEWTNLSEGFCFTSEDFQLSQRIFESGSTYGLTVTYPGGQTGVLSFQYDGELSILDYSSGDRDGGDADGSGSGSVTQPAPTPEETPSNFHGENSPNNGNTIPVQTDSSSEPNDIPQDSTSTPQEEIKPQEVSKPQEEQSISSGDIVPAITVLQTISSSQNGDNHNLNNTPNQIPTSDIPMIELPASDIPTTEIPMAEIPMAEIPMAEVPTTNIPTSEMPTAEIPSPEIRTAEIPVTPTDSTVPVHSDLSILSEAKNDSSKEISEFYSPTQTIISALRLKDLCADEENVVFGSGDLTVSIPSSLLMALNLSDSDTLTVMLSQPKNNQILLAVEVSGKSITELTGAVLRFRYNTQSQHAEIFVQNEEGEQIVDASYDGEYLRFKAETARTYTIVERSNKVKEEKSIPPLLPVSGGVILAAGVFFFRRSRHG